MKAHFSRQYGAPPPSLLPIYDIVALLKPSLAKSLDFLGLRSFFFIRGREWLLSPLCGVIGFRVWRGSLGYTCRVVSGFVGRVWHSYHPH